MARATRIATAGFTLIRTRPRAVMAWGFVYLLFAVVVSLLTRPLVAQMMLAMPRPGVGVPPVMDWTLLGPVLIANLGMYGMLLILRAAAMRAVLKPEEQGAFFIRVGMDELRLIGTLTLLMLLGLAVYLVSILVMTIVVTVGVLLSGGAAAVATSDRHLTVFAWVALLMLALFAVMIVFQIRFMLAVPLTILRGRVVVGEAWMRSKGHFWSLFGGVALGGMIVGIVSLAAFVPVLALMRRSGDGWSTLADPARQIALMDTPWLHPFWLLTPLLGGFFVAMTGGALGQAVVETETAG